MEPKINRLLITGGTGFIGHWLEKTMDVLSPTTDEYYYGGLLSKAAYDNPGKDAGWDKVDYWNYIIHLAPVPVDRVIECAKRCNARILFASSGGVYDREPSDYFRMKQEDERKLLESGLDVRIARIFTTCGAHMDWKRYAIGNFIIQASQGKPITVFSRGLVVRSYMYGSDLAEWLWRILLDGQPGGIYNVGSDAPYSTQELAFEVASHFVPRPRIDISHEMANEPRPWYVPDTSRARAELGLTIKVPFHEAVRRTVEDYQDAY